MFQELRAGSKFKAQWSAHCCVVAEVDEPHGSEKGSETHLAHGLNFLS